MTTTVVYFKGKSAAIQFIQPWHPSPNPNLEALMASSSSEEEATKTHPIQKIIVKTNSFSRVKSGSIIHHSCKHIELAAAEREEYH